MENLDSILKPLRKIILTENSLEHLKQGFPLTNVSNFIFLEKKLSSLSVKEKQNVPTANEDVLKPTENSPKSFTQEKNIYAKLIVQEWEEGAIDLIKLIQEDKSQEILDTLVAASKLSKVCRRGIVLCLVILLKKSTDPKIISNCYSAVPLICKTSLLFMLFIQLCKIYSASEAKSAGWGRGMKRAIRNWYLQWEPRLLALEVTRYPSAYSWTHKDILKMAHIKLKDLPCGTAIILHFIYSGFEETKKKFKGEENSKEILQLLEVLHEGASEMTDTEVITKRGKNILAKFGSISLKDFPSQALFDVEILSFLVDNGSPQLIIEALRTTNLFKLLYTNEELRNRLINKMKTDQFAKDTDVLKAVITYNCCRRISAEMLKCGASKEKQWMKLVKPNPKRNEKTRLSVPRPKEIDEFFSALSQVVTKGAQNISKLEKDILICLDLEFSMENFISVVPDDPISKEVRGIQVVSFLVLAMTLIPKLETVVPCLQNMKKEDYMEGPGAFHWLQSDLGRLTRLQTKRINVEESLNLAIERKVSTCIIICSQINKVLGNEVYEKFSQLKAADETLKLRVVVCGLDYTPGTFDAAPCTHPDLLYLFGVNEATLPVLHAFAEGFL